MNVLGLSAFYHDSSCCLLRDGELVAAVSEERFSGIKHDPRLPVAAFRYCLEAGGIDPCDIDALAYYESPIAKLARQLWSGERSRDRGRELAWIDPGAPERAVREALGHEGAFFSYPHHLAHAASAYFFSGFDEAAVLTVDGVGEWTTTAYGAGRGGDLELFEEVLFPHSLGLLYSTLTSYLGFAVNDGEGKVMGLAPWGEPRLLDRLRRLARVDGGGLRLDIDYFDFVGDERMYSQRMVELLGEPPRRAGEPLSAFHRDLASSLQRLFEQLLLEMVRHLAGRVSSSRLCLGGGAALNCVAVGRVRREGPFRELFVQPAAGDAGGCLGAAALAHRELTGRAPSAARLRHLHLGPGWSADEIASLLAGAAIAARDLRARETELLDAVADHLAARRVVGWFQGAMEFGPRALGARSILANPLDPRAAERVNRLVKRREPFRPFAPCVLEESAARHLDLRAPSPFMLETCRVISALELPAVTHVDGSTRPQTVERSTHPRLAALLEAFERRTGCPLLLNTSMNLAGLPLVRSPADALLFFAESKADVLVLEDFLLERRDLAPELPALAAGWRAASPAARAADRDGVAPHLYTFV